MAIHFKSIEAEEKEYQVLHLNAVTLYLISVGWMKELHVPADAYEKEGEVYLHQVLPETEEEESRRKALYDELIAAAHDSDIPSYDELVSFDDIIPLKALYEMGVDDDGKSVMVFKDIIPLSPDEQLAYDEDGYLVPASELEDDDSEDQ